MTTYLTGESRIRNRYNPERWRTFEHLGRRSAVQFLTQRGFTCGDLDKDLTGYHDWRLPDLEARHGDTVLYVEAGSKRFDLIYNHVRGGGSIDIEERKSKYAKFMTHGYKCLVCISDYLEEPVVKAGNVMVVVPYETIILAEHSCGEGWYGLDCQDSPGFVVPSHGCMRVRKKAKRGKLQEGHLEDFYRISYDFFGYYERPDEHSPYSCLHKPTKRVVIGPDGAPLIVEINRKSEELK